MSRRRGNHTFSVDNTGRCIGTNRKMQRCKSNAMPGSNFCKVHTKQKDTTNKCLGFSTTGARAKPCNAKPVNGTNYCKNHLWQASSEDDIVQKYVIQIKKNKKQDYGDYLKSDHWKYISSEVRRLADYRCQVCNNGGETHIHHRTYERKGHERISDLVCLCKNCHQLFHDKLP